MGLNMPYMGGKTVGIQFTDQSVRCAVLASQGSIHALQTIPIPEGMIVDGRIQHGEEVLRTLEPFLGSLGRISAIASMPNSRMYTMGIWCKSGLSEVQFQADLLQAVARRSPIETADAVISIEESARVNDYLLLDVYMAEREDTGHIQSALHVPKVDLTVIEMQALSNYRAILHFGSEIVALKDNELAVLLELDSDWPTISLFDYFGGLFFSRSIPLGAIRSANNAVKHDNRVDTVEMQLIESSIQRVVTHFRSLGYEIPRLYLAGDAGVIGPDQLSTLTSLSLNVFPVVERLSIPFVEQNEVLLYLTAIGAALRSRLTEKQSRRHNLLHPF